MGNGDVVADFGEPLQEKQVEGQEFVGVYTRDGERIMQRHAGYRRRMIQCTNALEGMNPERVVRILQAADVIAGAWRDAKSVDDLRIKDLDNLRNAFFEELP